MFGAGLSGSYSKTDTKQKSKSDFWTSKQHQMEKGLGQYFQQWIDPKTGKLTPVASYTGQLPGTYTPGTMQTLFTGAEQYAKGGPLTREQAGPWAQAPPEGSQLFQHYKMYSDPAEREKRIAETLEARRRLLAPEQEKEDALLKAQARSMGLQHSSDVLKKQMDVAEVRRAEEDALALGLMDKYEQLGYQASEAGLQRLRDVSSMQYQITNAGLEAEFEEWLRKQPEMNPVIQQIMAYLGLQGVATTKGKATTTSWTVSGSAQYGSGGGGGGGGQQQQGGGYSGMWA